MPDTTTIPPEPAPAIVIDPSGETCAYCQTRFDYRPIDFGHPYRYALVPGHPETVRVCRRAHLFSYCGICLEYYVRTDGDDAPSQCPRTGEHTTCDRCGGNQDRHGSCRGECSECNFCLTVGPPSVVDLYNDMYMCAPCEASAHYCDDCDCWTQNSDECGSYSHSEYSQEEEEPYTGEVGCTCQACRNNQREQSATVSGRAPRVINNYSYKPRPDFRGNGPLFLGPEIEVEMMNGDREPAARHAYERLDTLGYLKEDGSISNGFEIVTHPMSYEWAMANFPWQMLTELWELGCRARNSTGIHIHVSRAGFSNPAHTYRWLKFVYRNAIAVQDLAGRRESTWAKFSKSERDAAVHYAKGTSPGFYHSPDRYSAVNVQNEETFELRVFRSTLRPKRLQAFFGFADASVEYTRQLRSPAILKGDGWDWPAFREWAGQHEKYVPLTNYLKDPASCVS